ncbi:MULTISPECIES: FGGY-family carbohydrate kinase [Microbacterium]|uniref:FGGY-family carbohydrate kinase n=1 Tax=Microbacterium TaxID=33882 RepID=UPI0027D91B3E|nr:MULTISPECIES: FGGY-family carbohydrate kinase [Microbacterium]
MERLLLGIDAGLTVTKSVIFDEHGVQVGVATRRVASHSPQPNFVERDQDAVWAAIVATVRDVVVRTGVDVEDIVAVGVTAHGDGLYLVDEAGLPVAPGILSLDTRARDVVERWREDGTFERALASSGQTPFASTPASLLRWFVENAPETLARARYALTCKDAMKARITGSVSTDRTEASLSFVDPRTQRYSADILATYGLAEWESLLPPLIDSSAVAGAVTEDAARRLGLRPGTPVVAGAHDVDCSAIGSGAVRPGQMSLIAGTYSINQAISSTPRTSERWYARSFVVPDIWIHQAVSPSSATNMEWFVREVAAPVRGDAGGTDAFAFVEEEVAAIAGDPDDVIYLPFLYGSPLADRTSGTFLGLRGWHRRGHLLRAVMQGVVYNHRWHVDDLLTSFDVESIHLTGGASNSGRWCQMFADALAREVRVAPTPEAGALGVCMLAGIGVGVYADLDDAVERAGGVPAVYSPDPDGVAAHAENYARYRRTVEAMRPVWSAIHR